MKTSYNLMRSMVLGTAIALTSLPYAANSQDTYTPVERQRLEDQALLNNTLGGILQSGIIPTDNPEDARFLHNLGNINRTLADHTRFKLRNETIRHLNSHPHTHGHAHPHTHTSGQLPQIPRVGTFVCNYVKDFDGDNSIKYPDEYIGLGKTNFKSNEALTLGVRPGPNKGTWTLKIFNPKGDEIYSRNKVFRKKNHTGNMRISPLKMIEGYGEGTFTAVYYWNGQFWDAKALEIRR